MRKSNTPERLRTFSDGVFAVLTTLVLELWPAKLATPPRPGCSGALGSVGPGHQFVDAGWRPEVDEPGQHIGHPGERIDSVEFAGFHERRDGRSVLGAKVMAGEERILAVKRYAANRALDRVKIDRDAAVVVYRVRRPSG